MSKVVFWIVFIIVLVMEGFFVSVFELIAENLIFVVLAVLVIVIVLFLRKAYQNYIAQLEEEAFKKIRIYDVDKMSGVQFEAFVAGLFSRMGYVTSLTERQDQGIDVVATLGSVKYGIQTKRSKSNITNKAVQEVFTGLAVYGCNKALVVTNRGFTKSARELAAMNGVELWDREVLVKHMEKFSVEKS